MSVSTGSMRVPPASHRCVAAVWKSIGSAAVGLTVLLGATACAPVAGTVTPALRLPPGWEARLPHAGRTDALLDWWDMFDDTALTTLLTLAEQQNASLAATAASIRTARAGYDSARAGLLPSADVSASRTRSGTTAKEGQSVPASTTRSGALDASWEIDLFGKVRAQAKAADARSNAAVADWHDARVSLSAEVADDYVQYRACRELARLYRDERASARTTIRDTALSVGTGLKSTADLSLVRASAATSSSSLIAQEAECDLLVKSLTELTGGDEKKVRALLDRGRSGIPVPGRFRVASVPADLVRQRPDLRALEWRYAADAYDLGVAKADLYPSLSLSGSITLDHNSLAGRSTPWSFGPSLALPLFDGGSRRAGVRSAEGKLDEARENYRAGVLSAVSEVETALVRLDSTRRRLGDASVAAQEYRAYFRSVDENWRAGGASGLDREEARRQAQSAELTVIELRRDAVRYWIALYKALGGGWTGAAAPARDKGLKQ
jgi:NodT family efflux transporter outer membrane factor (OMF) lipoprotein